MDRLQRCVRVAFRKILESDATGVTPILDKSQHCRPIYRAGTGLMAAGNIRNMEVTNLGKMVHHDFLEISAHDAEMI